VTIYTCFFFSCFNLLSLSYRISFTRYVSHANRLLLPLWPLGASSRVSQVPACANEWLLWVDKMSQVVRSFLSVSFSFPRSTLSAAITFQVTWQLQCLSRSCTPNIALYYNSRSFLPKPRGNRVLMTVQAIYSNTYRRIHLQS
jgi:hypothetical protein